MVAAFKQMVNRGLTGWTLHLAGGTTPGEEHQVYLASVCEQAQGYPIVIHPDIPYPELAELYATSSIYWHASGYGEDEQRAPEKSEHFGITTIEAMAAGCVPVVIGKGGQPELVQHGKNGLLWHTLEELQKQTSEVIGTPSLRERLSTAALRDSGKYDKEHFNRRVDELLRRIGASAS
jgi:glycosyltransferase involved in cell wall biosynthesis